MITQAERIQLERQLAFSHTKWFLKSVLYVSSLLLFLTIAYPFKSFRVGGKPSIGTVEAETEGVVEDDEIEIKVLYWTTWFQESPMASINPENPACLKNCHFFSNTQRHMLNESDAVIFHSNDVEMADLPRTRSKDQVWVLLELESPITWRLREEFNQINFNWTMTYRRDSDVHHPYIKTVKVGNPSLAQAFDRTLLDTKTKQVVWFVSNCFLDYSDRTYFVDQLSNYIKVDSYGLCGNEDPKFSINNQNLSWALARQQYKFYLAFENSLCSDYITEKLRNPLVNDIVPIVRGGGNYSNIAPPHSFINADNFESPKKLADYLIYLDKNPEEYLKYFEWKKSYRIEQEGIGWCNLCRKLREQKRNPEHRSHSNVSYWWYETVVSDKPDGTVTTAVGSSCVLPNFE